jgi:predicted small lipoprotein YifL
MKRTLSVMMAAILSASVLAGCGEDGTAKLAEREINLAVVLGSHANAPVPHSTPMMYGT